MTNKMPLFERTVDKIVTDNSTVIAALNDRIAELEKERDQILNSALDSESNYCELKDSLPAHNLEQQAKALNDYADSILKRDRLFHINLSERMTIHDSCRNQAEDYLNQAKALKEAK